MEFKYRAGENRPRRDVRPRFIASDDHVTAQALRGSYVGSGLRRMDPLQNSMLTPAAALRRQIEKEQIREEIIAREAMRRSELEEEVRRELAYEREVALRRQAERFSLATAAPTVSSALMMPESQRFALQPSSTHGAIFERVSVPSPQEFEIMERLPFSGRHDLDGVERLPAKRHFNDIREIHEVNATSPNFSGCKRKAAPEAREFVNPKNVKKEWYCDVCQVCTTSQETLNEHLDGKKHKAKEGELNGRLVGTSSKPDQKLAMKKENDTVGDNLFCCELCNVGCNSEFMLASHMHGKKHLSRMWELEHSKATLTKKDASSRVDAKLGEVVKVKQALAKQFKQEVASSTPIGPSRSVGKLSMSELEANESIDKATLDEGDIKSGVDAKTVEVVKAEQTSVKPTKEEGLLSTPIQADKSMGKHALEHLKSNKSGGKATLTEGDFNSGADAKTGEVVKVMQTLAKHVEEEVTLSTPITAAKSVGKKLSVQKVKSYKSRSPQMLGKCKSSKKTQLGSVKQPKILKWKTKVLKKRFLRCDQCRVKCNSELMLVSHLQGKRHFIRMQELEGSKALFNHFGRVCGKADAVGTSGNNESITDGKDVDGGNLKQCSTSKDVMVATEREDVALNETGENAHLADQE